MKKDQTFTHTSTKTAGGDPSEGADPGGARSTKPGQPDKSASKTSNPKVQQTVASGDRNTQRESRAVQP
jgi:hypothetical protein